MTSPSSGRPAERLRGAAIGLVLGTLSYFTCTILVWQKTTLLLPAVILGTALGATRLRLLVWIAAAGLTVTTLVVAYTPIVVAPAHRLVRADSLGAADAVVVLSSGLNDDALILPDAADRLLTGLRLLEHHAAPQLVLTRLHRKVGDGEITSDEDQRRLIAVSQDSVPVFTVDSINTTHDEAVRVATLAKREGWTAVIVVTSPLHTRRACATFEKVGLRVACVPSESREFAVRALRGPRDRMTAFRHWLYETAARVKYRWKGWI